MGVNVVLPSGRHALGVLSPYTHALPAAERALAELQVEAPLAEILWTTSTYDPTNLAQLAELVETDAATFAERTAEGMQ